MNQYQILIITIEIIILLISLYIGFFKNYFNEKGKQLALKEDVEEITRIVENTKAIFIKDIEYIKSELQVKTNNKSKFNEKKMEIILEFFSNLMTWKDSINNISAFELSTPDRYNDRKRLIQTSYNKLEKSHRTIKFFINSATFSQSTSNLITSLLSLKTEIIAGYLNKCSVCNHNLPTNKNINRVVLSEKLNIYNLEILEIKKQYIFDLTKDIIKIQKTLNKEIQK